MTHMEAPERLLPSVFVSHLEASAEATHIISAIGEVPSVPAPCDTEAPAVKGIITETGPCCEATVLTTARSAVLLYCHYAAQSKILGGSLEEPVSKPQTNPQWAHGIYD